MKYKGTVITFLGMIILSTVGLVSAGIMNRINPTSFLWDDRTLGVYRLLFAVLTTFATWLSFYVDNEKEIKKRIKDKDE